MVRYRIKNTSLALNEETGETVVYENGNVIMHTDNPIIGFNSFWSTAGFEIRQEIRDKIESHGFSRWTGEKL